MAEPNDSGQSVADDQTAATTTVAAVDSRRSYRLLTLEIAESYETLDELIVQTTNQWRELVTTDFTEPSSPKTRKVMSLDRASSGRHVPCGQSLLTYMYAMPDIDGVDTLRISETTINGIPITIAVLVLTGDHSPDTAALLTAGEPTCTVSQIATLSP